MVRIECSRCGHFMAGGGDVACMAGSCCPTGCGGKMRSGKCMPWDEPERLAFYGVDPGAYGNRERAETVQIDDEGDLTVTGYWR